MNYKAKKCRYFHRSLLLIALSLAATTNGYADDESTGGAGGFFDHDIANKGLLDGVEVNAPHRATTKDSSNYSITQTKPNYYRRHARRQADSFAVDSNSGTDALDAAGAAHGKRSASEITPSFEVEESQPLLMVEKPVAVPSPEAVEATEPKPADKTSVAEQVVSEVTAATDEANRVVSAAEPGSPEYVQAVVDQVKNQTGSKEAAGKVQPKNAVTDANRF